MRVKAEPGKVCIVSMVPACDYCGASPETIIDAPTIHGPWACMCDSCWHKYGRFPGQLGVGVGQRWVPRDLTLRRDTALPELYLGT